MPNLPLRPTRLAIQSDCRLTRETLSACLAAADGFEVIGHTGTADGLRSLCALGRPDVCLVQAGELTARTVQMLRSIHDSFPAVDLVVAYSGLTLELLAEAVRAGVASFVPCSRGLGALVRLLRQWAGRARVGPLPAPDGQALTDRELAIVSLLSSGHTVSDIARQLRISPHTVDNHKRRMFAKFGVGSQGLAVARAVALGLVARSLPDGADLPHLTSREHDILGLLARGHTIRQAARTLGIAAKTVENTQARLYRKLGTRNRAETLTVAYRLGFLDPANAASG